ncbi:NAD(P)/FAD-dependent oxidoreductase [Gordonia desulfuricans]|uniref:NAD(P)/FAD-dependent oxidoreductase n=1 Tax=Gordonia desulfuricans TaxID=89051 RepID=A0A7K3LPS8_9ACTN|nr:MULTISPECIES: NAD(P)/FAD-dependent oxidoreductase [Gordonia]NDK90260.1 NAD(P)/FAD-dependent oxidoreductase [Gordonia desulfuricans]WLP91702.1 NAD(P)/FAD-dependent oxidoreductase [Gordonia sp. NB41Y]
MSRSGDNTDTYDVVVIGGGPAGENAADYAIRGSGRTAVIIEDQLVGGECSYWACMPSKALLGAGAVLEAAAGLPGSAPRVTSTRPDRDALLGWRDTMTSHRDDASQVRWLDGAGIDLVRGRARLTGEDGVVEVDGRRIRAREAVVLATGSTASIPDIPGLRDAAPWTSRDVTAVVEVPERVGVLGGGVVACEAATWLTDLGATVTMAVRGQALLPAMEPWASAMVAEGLRARGVDLRFGETFGHVQRVKTRDTGPGRVHGGPVRISLTGADGSRADGLEVDEVLVAAGRRPATVGLGLETLGIDPTQPLDVDDHLNVAGRGWLYAVGDTNGRAPLTHMGKYQARVVGDVISARAEGYRLDGPRYRALADHSAVPQVVFTRPEVASVGMTEQTARAAGIEVRTTELDIAVAGSALVRSDYRGHAGLVIDALREVIVGATFVGPDVAELLHSATVAVVGEVPLDRLWHAVPAYPTVSEVWLRLLESLH